MTDWATEIAEAQRAAGFRPNPGEPLADGDPGAYWEGENFALLVEPGEGYSYPGQWLVTCTASGNIIEDFIQRIPDQAALVEVFKQYGEDAGMERAMKLVLPEDINEARANRLRLRRNGIIDIVNRLTLEQLATAILIVPANREMNIFASEPYDPTYAAERIAVGDLEIAKTNLTAYIRFDKGNPNNPDHESG